MPHRGIFYGDLQSGDIHIQSAIKMPVVKYGELTFLLSTIVTGLDKCYL